MGSADCLARYSLLGSDDHGYTMLHRAISMAESLGIVNSAQMIDLGDSNYSIDMQRSLNRTAWGLFQVDTYVCHGFSVQFALVHLWRLTTS